MVARMKIPRPGSGYMHLPDWVTDEYLEQLTGEKKITVRDKWTPTKPVSSSRVRREGDLHKVLQPERAAGLHRVPLPN